MAQKRKIKKSKKSKKDEIKKPRKKTRVKTSVRQKKIKKKSSSKQIKKRKSSASTKKKSKSQISTRSKRRRTRRVKILPSKPVKKRLRKKVKATKRVIHKTQEEAILTQPEINTTHSHHNKGRFDRLHDIFNKAFSTSIYKHTPFQLDEVFIYRFGVSFNVYLPRKEWNEQSEKYISNLLKEFPDSSIEVIDISSSAKSIRLYFGDKEKGILMGDASSSLEDKIEALNKISNYLHVNYGEDIYWDTFWETEESIYE